MAPSALRGSSPVGDSHSSAERGRERERRREQKLHRKTRSIGDSLGWIFRTNLPPRRGAPIQNLKKRDWFGFGDVLGVIAKPSAALQQLDETRKALEKTQRELRLCTTSFSLSLQEQLSSLSSLPSFNTHILPRPSESSALHQIFTGLPSFTILCGAPSTGKTTLLRQVLKDEKYYTLYLDMRIIGGAGLEGLFNGLCDAVEWLAESMLKDLKDGQEEESRAKVNEEFEKVARAVKLGVQHLSTHLQKAPSYPKSEKDKSANFGTGSSETEITTHDVTRLIQLLRTALLLSSHLPSRSAYTRSSSERQPGRPKGDAVEGGELTSSEETKVGLGHAHGYAKEKEKGKENNVQKEDRTDEKVPGPSTIGNISADTNEKAKQKAEDADDPVSEDESEKWEMISEANQSWTRRIPVLVFDDAHKLPSFALSSSYSSSFSGVSSFQIVRFLLEGLAVLSKQDKLCHVVHSANDGSYVNWLRELGVLEGCKIVTVSDTSKTQVHTYLTSIVLPSILPPLRSKLESEEVFEKLYEAFGGRLAHWDDFVGDWLNAGGNLPVERSNAFLQAYTQLNFLLMRTSEAEAEAEAELELEPEEETVEPHYARDRDREHDRHEAHSRPRSRCCCCRTQLKTKFRSRSSLHLPVPHTHRRGMKSSTTLLGLGTTEDVGVGSGVDLGDRSNTEERIPFTVMQLLDVFYRLTSPSLASTSSHVLASTLSPTIRPVSMRSVKVVPRVTSETERADLTRKDTGIPYFAFCRELGACLGSAGGAGAGTGMRAVDFLIRERIVELRWTHPLPSQNPMSNPSRTDGVLTSSYHLDNTIPEEDGGGEVEYDELDGVGANGTIEIGRFGPTLHPLSPILAYAMRVVLDEYGYQPAEIPEDDADVELVEEGIGARIGTGRRRGRNDEPDNDDLFYRSDGHNERGGGGRESSGLSDGQSDYVSLEDVSEY